MVARNPDRSKPLVTVPRVAIGPVMSFWLSLGPTASAYGLGVTSACWGAAAGIVQCRETSVIATFRTEQAQQCVSGAHWITSSARANRVGSIVMPSALAELTLVAQWAALNGRSWRVQEECLASAD
jgi:hypothetical protein